MQGPVAGAWVKFYNACLNFLVYTDTISLFLETPRRLLRAWSQPYYLCHVHHNCCLLQVHIRLSWQLSSFSDPVVCFCLLLNSPFPIASLDLYSWLQMLYVRCVCSTFKLLTAAVPGLERDMLAFTATTLPYIYRSVDFLNVMTYDLVNRRDTVTNHHSGLDGSIEAIYPYLDREEYGYPQNLNIGLGFYVRWYRVATDDPCNHPPYCPTELMEDPITGADLGKAGAFSWHDYVPSELVYSFARALKLGEDDVSEGPLRGHFYVDRQEHIFWSWDTPQTIIRKLEEICELF
jgi:hypothetical protein